MCVTFVLEAGSLFFKEIHSFQCQHESSIIMWLIYEFVYHGLFSNYNLLVSWLVDTMTPAIYLNYYVLLKYNMHIFR